MFFWNFLAFSMIQQMLAIWSLVSLPFLNLVWASGSSQFTYYWSLAWRILSITLLAWGMSAMCGILNILWHCLSLGLEWKLIFSSPVATAVSKSTGIFSAEIQFYLQKGCPRKGREPCLYSNMNTLNTTNAAVGHRTGKGQFSFQSQRRAVPKNVEVTAQLHSFPMLAK